MSTELLDRPVPTTIDPVDDGTRRELLIGGAALALGLAACGGEKAPPQEVRARTIDHLGGSTRIEGRPDRVVILDDAMLGYVLPLGVTPVGIAHPVKGVGPGEPVYEKLVDYETLEIVAPDYTPNLEKVAAVRPDLIVTLSVFEINDELERIAPTVVLENDYDAKRSGLKLFVDNFQTIAAALGREQRAERVLADLDRRLAEVKARFSEAAEGRTVSYVRFNADDTIRVDGPGGFGGGILTEVGFRFPPAQVKQLKTTWDKDVWAGISAERARLLEADVLVVQTARSDEEVTLRAAQRSNPLIGRLDVVREERVATADQGVWFSRSVLGVFAVLDDLEADVLPLLQQRAPA